MQVLNITNYEKNLTLGSLKEVLDYLPIILVLGIIAGFGSFTTLIGAFILSLVFLIFGKKYSFIFAPTVAFVLSAASINVSLGGKSETLFALLFVSSLLTILISLLNVHKKTLLTIPKPVISGFMAGCFVSALMLSIPLMFGQKTFSSLPLMLNSKVSLFSNVNEISIVFSCLTFAIYYYFSKSKIKILPSAFLAVIFAGFINYFHGFNLENIYIGIKAFTPVATADFGHFIRLLFSGILLSLVIVVETLLNLKISKKMNGMTKSPKKPLFLLGLANALASITGSVGGTLAIRNENGKKKLLTLIEAVVLFFFIMFFEKISSFIPICAIGSILFIKSYEIIKNYILAQKIKIFSSKIIFAICLFATFYNVIFGLMVSIVFALIVKTRK